MDKDKIGLGQKMAIIRFFFKIDVNGLSIDKFSQLWGEAKYLIDIGILNLKLDG